MLLIYKSLLPKKIFQSLKKQKQKKIKSIITIIYIVVSEKKA